MIVSVSTQLPPPRLTANEVMQRVHELLMPLIELPMADKTPRMEQMFDAWVALKHDCWGSSDG